ncbi:MAG: peptidylprolyl isomerase [Bacilli bacterium]|nr:peptidylprolyl isomerase [Bacilli bacterium]
MKKVMIASLSVMLLLTGCRQIPKLKNGQEAVVSLTNEKISVDDLYDEMKNKYALSMLIDMVDEKILSDKYEETDEELKYIENQRTNDETYYKFVYAQSYSTFDEYARARYGIQDVSELQEIYRLSYRRNQAVKDYVKGLVTDSEIETYYNDEFIADIEASHILITADYSDDATDEEKAKAEEEALNTAKEVIEKLNNGEDFAELAKTYSKDGSASEGGALGRFGSGDMVEEFEKAAYALEVGKYTTEPVKTQFGYHIILKTKEYDKDPIEDAKEEIVETLADRKISADSTLSYKALDELRSDNGMKIEDSDLNSQYENYIYNTTNQ